MHYQYTCLQTTKVSDCIVFEQKPYMLFFEKDDEYEAEVKLLDLLRNHKKDQTSWNTILHKSLPSTEKRNKTLPPLPILGLQLFLELPNTEG